MKFGMVLLLGILIATTLGGCCTTGYYAPPYKLTVVGCAPAFVPAN